MRKFLMTVLGAAVFFVGLGALVDKAGAHFKSDEKALALVAKARQAIGGDAAIANIQSLSIVGKTSKTFKFDGAERAEQGDTEIAIQFPDKVMKMTKLGHGDESGKTESSMTKTVDLVVLSKDKDAKEITVTADGNGSGAAANVQRILIKKADGTVEEINGADAAKIGETHGGGIMVRKIEPGQAVFTTEDDKSFVTTGDHVMLNKVDGNAVYSVKRDNVGGPEGNHVFLRTQGGHAGGMEHNEMLRLTLGLLLTSPKGMDVSYTYGGEGDVDGTPCSIVVADFAGSSYKIYLSQSSSLPVMLSYTATQEPMIVHFKTKATSDDAPESGQKEKIFFDRKIDGPAAASAEVNVKFSDFRSVNGVQLPYKWTQTVGGNADETFDVTSYDVNPANIGDKFKNQTVMVRTMKPDNK